MKTEHQLGQHGKQRTRLSMIAQAFMRTSGQHLEPPKPYGDHADLLGVGGADAHNPHVLREVEHGK